VSASRRASNSRDAPVDASAGRQPPANHAEQDAASVGLRYVRPDERWIQRRRSGRGFRYLDADGHPVGGSDTLERIRSLAIPPAWTEVRICPSSNGHLQAVGRDARGRRQYRYHPRFRARRDVGKFARLLRFAERLPRIRRRVDRDLARHGLPREKVLAAVVRLLETTRFRVGNPEYARLNQSFGLSTLRQRHAKVAGSRLRFRFKGKGGRIEERSVVDPRLAVIVRRCQELPGQELFAYIDEDGDVQAIQSEDVNAYLREAAGSVEFSAKDMRTWTATMVAFDALRAALRDAGDGPDANVSRPAAARSRFMARVIAEAVRRTAQEIGDSPAVARESYVHPALLVPEALPELPGRPPRPGPRGRDEPPGSRRRDELALLAVLRASDRGTPASES